MAKKVVTEEELTVVHEVKMAVAFLGEAHPPGKMRRPVGIRQEEVMPPTVYLAARVLVERPLVLAKSLG